MDTCTECQKYKKLFLDALDNEGSLDFGYGKITKYEDSDTEIVYGLESGPVLFNIDKYIWMLVHGVQVQWYVVYGDKHLDPKWHEYYNQCKYINEHNALRAQFNMSQETTPLKIMEHGDKYQRAVYLTLEMSLKEFPPPHPSYE